MGQRLNNRVSNEKGFVLTALYLIFGVISIILATFYGYAWSEHQSSLRYEQGSQAFFLAETALDQKIREIEANNLQNIQSTALGRGNFSATYNAGSSMVTASAVVQDSTRSVVATLAQGPPFQPRAAVTVNGVPVLSGSVTVDGRNHDANGNLLPGNGVFGVSTSAASVSQQGNSTICGGNGGCGNPADPSLYEVNVANLPSTPEAILGVPQGSLDRYRTATLPQQFSGIVYFTGSANQVNLGGTQNQPAGSGILIVHNDDGTALLKNLRGTFKGIIIADQVEHIHGTVIGALETMNASQRQVGNGTGQVLYSTQAISNLPISSMTTTSWRDLQNDPDPQTAAVTYS